MNILISDDTIVFGLLFSILGVVFYLQDHPRFKKFFNYVPALLLCYFLPGLLNSFGVVNAKESNIYFIASRYLLPAVLILLTLSVDIKQILKLGPKALIMFFTGLISVILGGPLAILFIKTIYPQLILDFGADELWRGMSTVAGSWIGGSANQASMKEVFEVSDDVFSAMVVVDIMVANIWMAILLILAAKNKQIDNKVGANTTAIEELKVKVENYKIKNEKLPQTKNIMFIFSFAFGLTSLSHLFANRFSSFFVNHFAHLAKFSLTSSFFWLVVLATFFGVLFSFTKLRRLEDYGASKLATVMLYVLVASIGMHMDIFAIFKNPVLFSIGLVWMSIHIILMLLVGRLIKAPLFFIAIGSQANIGGAASAPVVASFFHPSLAPVGVLLAVLGYVFGTYGAWLCAILMSYVS